VAFAPARPGEAALLASGSRDDTVRLWGVDDGECKRVLEGHSEFVLSVAFAPARPGEAALLASGSGDNPSKLLNSLKSGAVDDGKGRNDTAKGHVFNSRIVSLRPKSQVVAVGPQR
jgi:WD40 repeat protein